MTPTERRAYARGLREAAMMLASAAEHRAPYDAIVDELDARAEAADAQAELEEHGVIAGSQC